MGKVRNVVEGSVVAAVLAFTMTGDVVAIKPQISHQPVQITASDGRRIQLPEGELYDCAAQTVMVATIGGGQTDVSDNSHFISVITDIPGGAYVMGEQTNLVCVQAASFPEAMRRLQAQFPGRRLLPVKFNPPAFPEPPTPTPMEL